MLAVPVSQRVIVKDGTTLDTEKHADAAVAGLKPTPWRTRPAGEGSRGVRTGRFPGQSAQSRFDQPRRSEECRHARRYLLRTHGDQVDAGIEPQGSAS